MTESIEGIILRVWPLTESSQIVAWLTAEHGRISTVARGARRPKSPFRGKLDLFYSGTFSFRRSRRSELHNLSEVILRETRTFLRQDLGALQMACYGAQLVELGTEQDTPLPEVFELFREFLEELRAPRTDSRVVLAFELRLLEELGLGPGEQVVGVSPAGIELLRHLTETDWAQLRALPIPPQQLKLAQRFLRGFILHHLGRVPKGREEAVSDWD